LDLELKNPKLFTVYKRAKKIVKYHLCTLEDFSRTLFVYRVICDVFWRMLGLHGLRFCNILALTVGFILVSYRR